MKYADTRPCADLEKEAHKVMEIANATEAVQDGRVPIEKINGPFLFTTASAAPNTAPGSTSQSRVAGCGGMNPAPT
jgi:hypothetical protein